MKSDVGKPARVVSGNGIVLITALLLMFPNSASVLCVGPDGHVAIEDINAFCPFSHNNYAPYESPTKNGFGTVNHYHNCTDIFLTPSGRASALKTLGSAAAGAHADECLGNQLSTATCFYQCLPDLISGYVDTSPRVTALIPMRS